MGWWQKTSTWWDKFTHPEDAVYDRLLSYANPQTVADFDEYIALLGECKAPPRQIKRAQDRRAGLLPQEERSREEQERINQQHRQIEIELERESYFEPRED